MSNDELTSTDVILYRLDAIERGLKQLMPTDLYQSEHNALILRVAVLEREVKENKTKNFQIAISAISPIITFILGMIVNMN